MTALEKRYKRFGTIGICCIGALSLLCGLIALPAVAEEAAPDAAGADVNSAKSFRMPDADPSLEPDIGELDRIAQGLAGKYTIRIPALTEASNGDLLASYDRRPPAANGDIRGGDAPNPNSILQRRSTDKGKTWGEEIVIAQGASGQHPQGYSDPSYVVDHDTGTIFNFHVYSQIAGVVANAPAYTYTPDGAIDEANEHVLNLGLSVSTDDGHTWKNRIITDQVLRDAAKRYGLTSCFMTSGGGAQKVQEPHRGRLLNQLTCVVKGNLNTVVAGTVYSDDHGASWHLGELTSNVTDAGRWSFNENKVVELSDGRLLLNSRVANQNANGYRIQAVSDDGGEHWNTDYRSTAPYLRDSGNNADIIRAYPNARPGTLRSRVLLFSNTNDEDGGRQRGVISMSVDDGATWPYTKELRSNGTGYTSMTVQSDGRIGLLMEPEIGGWNDVGYQSFTMRWLQPDLVTELRMTPPEHVEATVGQPVNIPLGVEHNDPSLKDSATLEGLPAGLSYDDKTQAIVGTPTDGIDEVRQYHATVVVTEEDDGTGMPRTAAASFELTLHPSPTRTESTRTDEGKTQQPEVSRENATPNTKGDADRKQRENSHASGKDADGAAAQNGGLASTGASSVWLCMAAVLSALPGAWMLRAAKRPAGRRCRNLR
ncbi:exo-alpha-sialidase [Bifidobacterium italicum]|uniref:exo-alpha-sialidase n=1 Tax=Bifidobacterium italicum TaxID=1960968 RepID=UPI000BABB232|nr:exo-alpha-sialidase [Bifidobacterium italicum]